MEGGGGGGGGGHCLIRDSNTQTPDLESSAFIAQPHSSVALPQIHLSEGQRSLTFQSLHRLRKESGIGDKSTASLLRKITRPSNRTNLE